jgi:hypothetical protein
MIMITRSGDRDHHQRSLAGPLSGNEAVSAAGSCKVVWKQVSGEARL